jgi:hypothetical protein
MTDVNDIVRVLHSSGQPLTANEIANRLNTTRRNVNPLLYGNLGIKFRKTEDEKPKWSLISSLSESNRADGFGFTTSPDGAIHVDQQGGDWSASVALIEGSRNDPPYRVEMTGIREAKIIINQTLLGRQDKDDWSKAYLMAGFALTNQILLQRLGDTLSAQQPDMILRDTLLAFGALKKSTD